LKHWIASLCLLLSPALATAETGFQFAAPNFNAPKDPVVSGMRLSFLYGKNQRTSGLDFGLLSISETGDMSGVGLILGVSRVTGDMSPGVTFSLVNYHSGRDSGLNMGFVNLLGEADGAFNFGFFTIARGATLVDLGAVNMSERSLAQVGFVNISDEIGSFQFGLLNMAKNGFLPVSPIFNFAGQ